MNLNLDIDASTMASTIVEKMRPWPWRRIAMVLTASFIVASAVSTAIGYFMMGQTDTRSHSPIDIQQESHWSTAPTLSKSQVDKILERNLFNSEGQMGDIDPNSTSTKASKTTLPVKVLGIIYGGNPFAGLAMVENTEKRTVNSFLVGDLLSPDATVKEIHVDQILISNMGRTEFAPLDAVEIRRSSRGGRRTTKPSTSLTGAGYATDAPPENYQEEGFDRKGNNVEMTQEYKNRLLTVDFANVLQDAKASPNVVDGVIKGWKLERIRKGSIYEKVGIQNGDVIEEINGAALTDASQAVKTLQQMRNEGTIEIRGSRSGQPFTKSLKVR